MKSKKYEKYILLYNTNLLQKRKGTAAINVSI